MEFLENQPIYMQIADNFCENILLEKWKPNERIPSVRDIAITLEVNPNTAMRAFVYLQEKDIIYNKRGIGYFVSEDGYQKALELKRAEFIEKDLPVLMKTMKLLDISCKEMETLYKETE
ncbi:MAG: GntR family transcriptional regulator [Bacteroidetes bacterium]|nr:MAG: GntR family transcriptional regulator [Bacteroidota bacterium]